MKKVTRQVLTTHTPREHVGGELTDSPTVSVSHSPTIDAKYIFVSQILSPFLILL